MLTCPSGDGVPARLFITPALGAGLLMLYAKYPRQQFKHPKGRFGVVCLSCHVMSPLFNQEHLSLCVAKDKVKGPPAFAWTLVYKCKYQDAICPKTDL